jgi:Threonine dehydrogenase and related Zn-dependent dehydrogenases
VPWWIVTIPAGAVGGGFAERVAVPATSCYAVSDLSSPVEHLAASEPVANAVHAMRLVEEHIMWPQRVAIIGAGAVGFTLALVGQLRGLPRVDLCDRVDSRLAWAEVAGARAVRDLDHDYDVIFDTVGSSTTRGLSLERLRPGGTAVWVGLHGSGADVDGQAMIRQEHRVITTFCYDRRDFQVAVDLMPRLPTGWVDTRPLTDGVEIFTSLMNAPGEAIKYVLLP